MELTGEGSTPRPTASTGGPSTSSSMERLHEINTKPPRRKFHKLRRIGAPNSCFIRSYEWDIWESIHPSQHGNAKQCSVDATVAGHVVVGAPENVHFKETRGVPSDLLEGSRQIIYIYIYLAGIEMDDDTFVLPRPRLTPSISRSLAGVFVGRSQTRSGILSRMGHSSTTVQPVDISLRFTIVSKL